MRAKSGLISPHKVIARMFSDLDDYDVVSGAYGGNGSTEGASLSQDGHKEYLVLIQGYVFSASFTTILLPQPKCQCYGSVSHYCWLTFWLCRL